MSDSKTEDHSRGGSLSFPILPVNGLVLVREEDALVFSTGPHRVSSDIFSGSIRPFAEVGSPDMWAILYFIACLLSVIGTLLFLVLAWRIWRDVPDAVRRLEMVIEVFEY